MNCFCCFHKDDLVGDADYGGQNMKKQSGGNDGKRTAQQAAQDVKVQPIEVEQLMISDHVLSLVKGHMQELKHDNFVELLGYSVDGNSRILVFGFAQN
ncbi:hypothetical protein F2Q69_00014297 [Brassica cretica]|uniref:Serine-threonine/tyrosine-protein kinase catalytic domain-containing protein n=1 Tax=Brassica cretica TaxID=69181 RepID=A0A8S9R8U6_BRACR|nr:hypothetical protein F2Q69_00014297 [Brassica cretica]